MSRTRQLLYRLDREVETRGARSLCAGVNVLTEPLASANRSSPARFIGRTTARQ